MNAGERKGVARRMAHSLPEVVMLLIGVENDEALKQIIQSRTRTWWRATAPFFSLPRPTTCHGVPAPLDSQDCNIWFLDKSVSNTSLPTFLLAVIITDGILTLRRIDRLFHIISGPDCVLANKIPFRFFLGLSFRFPAFLSHSNTANRKARTSPSYLYHYVSSS